MDNSHQIYKPPDAEGLSNTDAGYTYPYKTASGTARGVQNIGDTIRLDSGAGNIMVQSPIRNSVPNVLMGYRGLNKSYGFFVSKSGVDVTKAADSDLIFNSNQDVFKIIDNKVASITLDVGYVSYAPYTASVAHGQTFTPIIMAFCDFPANFGLGAGKSLIPLTVPNSADGTIDVSTYAMTDGTNVTFYLKARNGGASNFVGTYNYHYYILQESAA